MPKAPPRIALAPDLEISRVVVGLWQVADMERGGRTLDPEVASSAMLDYARAGFDSFDMADHYGTAELIAGRFLSRVAGGEAAGSTRPAAFTKWCPTPGPMTAEIVREGVERSRKRLGVEAIDLLQFHWWAFEHPAYLDAMKRLEALRREGFIRHLGVTNFDTAHLRVLVKHGIPVVSNQVSFSLLDRRAAGEMSAFCLENGVRLLAYGALAGGLMSERWLGRPEPASDEIADWSKMKYKRFVDAAGGWGAFQTILRALDAIAKKHGVSIANVATRWTLDHPAVAAVIVGARLGERDHANDNLAIFSFALDDDDRARIDAALASTTPIAGDCGDEYRRPPFLTASGDLSDHLEFDAEGLCGDAASKGGRDGCASHPAAPSSRSPATAARSGSATGCSSAARRRPTAPTKSSVPAIPPDRRRSSSTRSPRASRRWAPDSTTSCARASISPTQIIGSRSRARTAGALDRSARPIRCSRSAG